jgi:uncharacterized membrane protein YagU involved in acid resistance
VKERIVAGIAGGIAGGVIFGAMMHVMGMISMIGGLVGSESVTAGWLVHLVISAALGLGFALTLGAMAHSFGAGALYGLLYGAVWWVLGPLLIMPVLMGGSPFPPIEQPQIMSLVGHLIYGVVLGLVYVAVHDRALEARPAAREAGTTRSDT